LVYANKEYLIANNITLEKETTTFDMLINCNVDFNEILANLSKYGGYVSEQQKDGVWYKSYFYYIKDASYVSHICTDVTDIQLELTSLKKEALFFKETNEGVMISDQNGYVESVNDAFCKITGYTKDEIIGKCSSVLSSGMHTKDFYEHMWDSLKYYGSWQGEIWNRRKNGEVYPEWLSISKSEEKRTNKITYLALFTDISSVKEADKKIHFYANHDHLTGLVNKAQFENMLKHSISSASRHDRKFALLFLDLDHFKEVNDTYGHNVGDMLLKIVASRFKKVIRKEDVIARIGGDEFNIILDDIQNESDAIVIAQKLIETVKEPIVIEGHNCYVTLSIGVSIFPNHGSNEIELTKNADAAMYEVKKNGRNDVLVYEKDFTQKLQEKVSLKNDLNLAIKNDEIEIYFQPVMNHKGELVSAEVLSRWNHQDRGFVPPDEFIQIAEKNGSILKLGQNIVKLAFEKLPLILPHVSENFRLAINISAREFFDEEYLKSFCLMSDDFGINPNKIELELTETHMMENHELAIENLQQLKKFGFFIALDDFGTGYSSLSYLKYFQLDKLKIDKSFIDNFLDDKNDEAIVKSVIQLAKIFNLEVQAEGVEQKEQVDKLIDLECDYFQGYYYAKPMEFSSFLEFVQGQNHDT
jgi:diguanylate cyclase (GGDEF)-like protein/PAS domain S-box-containing protein